MAFFCLRNPTTIVCQMPDPNKDDKDKKFKGQDSRKNLEEYVATMK